MDPEILQLVKETKNRVDEIMLKLKEQQEKMLELQKSYENEKRLDAEKIAGLEKKIILLQSQLQPLLKQVQEEEVKAHEPLVKKYKDLLLPLFRYSHDTQGYHFQTEWNRWGTECDGGHKFERQIGRILRKEEAGTRALDRYHNPTIMSWVYLTKGQEVPPGFTHDWTVGFIFDAHVDGSVPLHRYRRSDTSPNFYFYTTDPTELEGRDGDFVDEGIEGYIFQTQ